MPDVGTGAEKGLRMAFLALLDKFQDSLSYILRICRTACRQDLQTFHHFNITLYVNTFP